MCLNIELIILLNICTIKTLKIKTLNISKQFRRLTHFKMMMSNMKNFLKMKKVKKAKKMLTILLIWFMKMKQQTKNHIILTMMKKLMKNSKKNYLMPLVRKIDLFDRPLSSSKDRFDFMTVHFRRLSPLSLLIHPVQRLNFNPNIPPGHFDCPLWTKTINFRFDPLVPILIEHPTL